MTDGAVFPDITPPTLERIFPRTYLAFQESERAQVGKEFAAGRSHEPHRFPAYLAQRKWAAGRGFVPDLARLEYALGLAVMAPEIEPLGFEGVSTASEPEWYQARFRFDPAHQLIDSEWPLTEIYGAPAADYSRCSSTILVYRSEGKASFRGVGGNEALLLRALQLGVPLGRVLERKHGPDFDAMTFHKWIETGLLRAILWAPV